MDITLAARGYVHHQAVVRSPRLEVQLKATAQQDVLGAEQLNFPLPVKNYNELREPSMIPRLLVILLLPASPDEWLDLSEERMIARRCAYWRSLLGLPDVANRQTVAVQLPRANCLTVQGLCNLMQRAALRQPL